MIIKVPDLYSYNTAIFMHQFINEKLPPLFDTFFTPRNSIHEHGTRQRARFRTPLYKTKIGTKFIIKEGINIYTEINDTTGFGYSLPVFKNLYKGSILARY